MTEDGASALIVAKPSRIRDSLKTLLRAVPHMQIVGQADNSPAAIKMITDYRPTLVLLDSNLPDDEIQTILRRTKTNQPQTRFIVLAKTAQQQWMAEAAGADSVLFAGHSAAKFFAAIEGLLAQQNTNDTPANSGPLEYGKRKPMNSTKELDRLILRNILDPTLARAAVCKLANSLGYNLVDQVRLAAAIFEIARNIVNCAGEGEIIIFWREDDLGHEGLEFLCSDHGHNAPGLTSVLQTSSNGKSGKLNLPGLRNLVDEFKVTADPKRGNCVTVVKWM